MEHSSCLLISEAPMEILGYLRTFYHLYPIGRQIDLPLRSITLNTGNVHIYETNIENTRKLLSGGRKRKVRTERLIVL